jgi:oligoribonuclease NrnB/cAMP/cGMP phosphodiesterase (DHH superfamily)
MDGKAAANNVYNYLAERMQIKSNMFIGKQPSDPYDISICVEPDGTPKDVYIVDLSFGKDTVKYLFDILSVARYVVWIDHHQTSKDLFDDEEIGAKLRSYNNLKYVINTNGCGAMLSYLYFHDAIRFNLYDEILDMKIGNIGMSLNRADYEMISTETKVGYNVAEVPDFIYLVDLWDRWVFGDSKKPEYLNYGFNAAKHALFMYKDKRSTEKSYNENFWDRILHGDGLNKVIRDGKVIKTYIDARNVSVMNRAYEANFEGYRALVLNHSGNSKVFGNKFYDYDICILWNYNGKTKKFIYSLYTADKSIDVAKIAEKFGGGGHPGASGFESETLMF